MEHTQKPQPPLTSCKIENCDKKVRAKELCTSHYQHWWMYERPRTERREGFGRPAKTVVTYFGMHSRLKRHKGSASNNPCHDCGEPAIDWSWIGACDEMLLGSANKNRPGNGKNPYCMHLEHYIARCHPCHISLDKSKLNKDSEEGLDTDILI